MNQTRQKDVAVTKGCPLCAGEIHVGLAPSGHPTWVCLKCGVWSTPPDTRAVGPKFVVTYAGGGGPVPTA